MGRSLFDLSNDHILMLVFLRHFGCVFCREALHDLAEMRTDFASKNIKLVFTHMAANDIAENYFKEYGLNNPIHISDPRCELYSQFGLAKGTISQLMGLKTWVRGFQAKKKGIKFSSKAVGDSLQMPGIFMIFNGKIIDYYIHRKASDRPDYNKLAECFR